jgi:hypothetical protein
MDCLIRERDGKDEIWYSENYLKQQIELAYTAGIFKGIRVDFHAIVPFNNEMVDDLVGEFNKRVNEEYYKAYSDHEVWKMKNK